MSTAVQRWRTPASLKPLTQPYFRALWAATVFSNIGTWMKDVGVAWMMTSLAPTPLMVSLVQAAGSLPIFLLALPAGALADRVDRRTLVMGTQLWMVAVSVLMTALAYYHVMTPWLLLGTSVLLAAGSALNGPAWQSILLDIVPGKDFPAAAALNSAGFNIARAIGPALGGMTVALFGADVAFAANAMSYLGVVGVLNHRKPNRPEKHGHGFLYDIAHGVRYTLKHGDLHPIFLRCLVFVLSGSVVWALLPLVAKRFFNGSPTSYGGLLGCFGVGAVIGATLLPRLRRSLTTRGTVNLSTLVFGLACIAIARSNHYETLCVFVFVAGFSWLTTLATLNVSVQAVADARLRARVISQYLLVFFGGQALGSTLWGVIATHTDLTFCFLYAGSFLTCSLAIIAFLPVPDIDAGFTAPTVHDPAPPVVLSKAK